MGVFTDLLALKRRVGQAAYLMVGVPDYDTYLAHTRVAHPERTPMTREEFIRERQVARYGGANRTGRCC